LQNYSYKHNILSSNCQLALLGEIGTNQYNRL